MKIRQSESGVVSGMFISLVTAVTLLVLTLGFAGWAFVSRQDYKNNADKKIAAAVEVAKKNTAAEKDNEFVEKEKYPLKSYKGPAELGSVSFLYPKTWSAYADTGTTGGDNFFIANPDLVSGADDALSALKITVEDEPYNDSITQYDGQIEDGKLKAKAYSLPKVPSVVGVRFDGEIEDGQPGALVILPIRDKSLLIHCMIPDRVGDFNKIILPNLSFNP
ncbi:MAG TPA: hypothetical protein VFK11_05015 [Candidatus Saccharimonadales bacterium]|nr:hypothetical protein [Candidatus Saccharimonadales bacterium]